MTPDEASNELCYDTLSHGGADFIHQHVVGAFGAQEASPNDKPIRLVFSLIGLYLRVENGFTGREVQLAHMKRCRDKPPLPSVSIPEDRGAINAEAVLDASADDRDTMIHEWCRSIWQAYSYERASVEDLLRDHKITDPRSVQRLKSKIR